MLKKDVLDEIVSKKLPSYNVIGIDIGSRQSKAILLCEESIYTSLIPTGFDMMNTAEELITNLLEQTNVKREEIEYIVGTGYGRIAIRFRDIPFQIVTEISCHGLGAHVLNKNVRTIIDIGGQDSKVIKIDPSNGNVTDFAMNDKCAAGTGRFLEKIAEVLGYDVTKIGNVAIQSVSPSVISSQCVVFAESEVVSERAKGIPVKDIAAGIHLSVARRVKALLGRVGLEKEILFTGGVSNNTGMRKAFEDLLGVKFVTAKLDTVYAGALGAAVFALKYAKSMKYKRDNRQHVQVSISEYINALEENIAEFVKQDASVHKAGYLCMYTPVEIFDAAGVRALRLMSAGSQKEVLAGEVYTQSVFCDITKSIIGGFSENNVVNAAVDHLYNFYACDCMRKTTEAIGSRFKPVSVYNLPRRRDNEDSNSYMKAEIEAFIRKVEKNAHVTVDTETIQASIRKYNRIRGLFRKITEYQKEDSPIISGLQFKKLMEGYFELPTDVLIEKLSEVLEKLEHMKKNTEKRPRVMITGGMMGKGDDQIIKTLEQDLDVDVVVIDNCTGIKSVYQDIKEEGDPVENLAAGYVNQPSCFRMTPVSKALEFSKKLAEEFRVDGVIYYYLKFCPCSSLMASDYTSEFQKLGIPVLVVAGDYASGDQGQILTRLEAFKEVLTAK